MKILNLYSGIGGNRKLWGNDHEITVVKYDERIACIYQDLWPDDTVIVGDAHQYLLDHHKEYEDGFIWASPPCPTHSRVNYFLYSHGKIRYPDMALYQEIIFLQQFFKGLYCVENVQSYYVPLIHPQVSGRHYFWANFYIPPLPHRLKIVGMNSRSKNKEDIPSYQLEKENMKKLRFPDLKKYKYPEKKKLLRNCVDPLIGKSILDKVLEIKKKNNIKQGELWNTL
ncbi:MAG: DNA cytosine methyltransferase [Prevotella sp.]|jgi:DNA (cytosine-5)-methyltransferase 1|nr:DNA cytosine methyltransferase [Prevotella sp.]